MSTRSTLRPPVCAARRSGEVLFVYPDSGVLNQLRPLGDFGFDYRCEFRRRVGDDLHAKILQMLAQHFVREHVPSRCKACR